MRLGEAGEAGEAAQSGHLFDYLRKGMANAGIGARGQVEGRKLNISVSMSMRIKVVICCI